MANQLKEWIQNDVITPLGNKLGATGVIYPNQVKTLINNISTGGEAAEQLKGLIEGTITDLNIPYGVTIIGDSALANKKSLVNVNIPLSVVEIGPNVFSGSTKIKNLTIPDSVTTINNFAFTNMYDINVEYSKNVSYIPGGCFNGTIINNFNIPNNVVTIKSSAFQKGTIKNITLPETLTTIEAQAFEECTLPNELIIPPSVNSIGNKLCKNGKAKKIIFNNSNIKNIPTECFAYCNGLEYVKLPETLETLSGYAFSNCSSLTSITLPNTVNRIEGQALTIGSSSKKATIILKSTTPPTLQYANAFNTSYLYRIYVPQGTRDEYISATNWSQLASYIFEPYNINFNIDSSLVNNETLKYSIDNESELVFDSNTMSKQNISNIRLINNTGSTIKIGTTNGGSEIGSIANGGTLSYSFIENTTIYITKQ